MPRSTHARRRTARLLAAAVALTGGAALAAVPGAQAQQDSGSADRAAARGAVYVLTNQPSGNTVVVYDRAADGTLTKAGRYRTHGTGTGDGLGSQGAVVLDDSGDYLYAVNAGSDTVSAFAVTRSGLRFVSEAPSGGDLPISVSVEGDLVYVLNAGGDGNVSGFSVRKGHLRALPRSTRTLSGTATDPAQVAITPDGRRLVVTEKDTQLIDVYRLGRDGVARSRTSIHSEGGTPFGFDFTPSGRLAVSEAGPSAASTYQVYDHGLRTIESSLGNNQAAACWLVVTDDGRFAYTGNGGGSNSVSGYRVSRDASLALLDADGRTGTAPAGVSDLALSDGSDYLYARLSDGSIGAFEVGRDGSLDALPVAGGLPDGAAGLAAR